MNNVDVSVRYVLSTVDKGVRQAVTVAKDFATTTRASTAQVDAALRASSRAWQDTSRIARAADKQIADQAISTSTTVSRELQKTIDSAHRQGASYTELAKLARDHGVAAVDAAAAIERSAARETAAIDRTVAAQNRLRKMVGLGPSKSGRSSLARTETRGVEHGAVSAAAGGLRTGASYLGAGLIGGLAGYVGVQGIKDAIDNTKELAKETQFLTQVTGMDSKTGAEWAAVAQSRDISTRTLNVSFKTLAAAAQTAMGIVSSASDKTYQTLALRTEGALQGNKKEIKAFQDLGISYDQVTSRQHNVGAIYDLVTGRLAKMRDGIEKTTIANTLLGHSATSTKSVDQAFKDLGISEQDLQKHSHDLTGLMDLVGDRLNKMRGGAAKTRDEAALFGKGFQQLTPILAGGAKAMEAQRKQAEAYGVTLGGNAAANTNKLREASEDLKLAQIGLEVQFAEHVAPALITVTEDGIKLFGVLRRDLGPAVHFVTDEVKDGSHWLDEHKTALKAVEIAVAGVAGGFIVLKTAALGVRVIRGVTSDVRMLWTGLKMLASPFSALKGLFGEQESESVALARSQNALAEANARLAASFDAVAASSKAAGAGEALTEETALAGGGSGLILPPGVRKGGLNAAEKAAPAEAELGTGSASALEQEASQGGLMAMMFGKTQLPSIISKVGPALTMAAKGGMFGLIGNQLGGMAGGAIGGKSGAGWGSAIGTGAGIGMMLGPEGALAGAAVGAGVHELSSLFGDSGLGGATKKLQGQMVAAAKAGDPKKLDQLSTEASKAAVAVKGIASGSQIAQLNKLAAAASKTANVIGAQKAAPVISGMLTAQTGARTVDQQLAAITPSLNKLTGKFQQAGALAAVQFAYGLQQKGKLPRDATDKLISDLEAKYPGLATYLQQQGASSMKLLADQLSVNKVQARATALIDKIHTTFTFLPTYAETAGNSTQAKMGTAMGELTHIIATGTAAQAAAAKPELQQLVDNYVSYLDTLGKRTEDKLGNVGKQWVNFGNTLLGLIPGLGQVQTALNNVVAAANAANQTAGAQATGPHSRHYMGGYVPGDPTRDGTLALLSGREFVLTGDGQQMMESYAPGLLGHIEASQLPHFSSGGSLGWGAASSPTKSSTSSTKAASPKQYIVPGSSPPRMETVLPSVYRQQELDYRLHKPTSGHFGSHTFTGAVSTFGPPGEAAGNTAYGGTDAVAGIAINPGDAFGGWNGPLAQSMRGKTFLVSVGAHEAFLPVVDKGPSAIALTGPYKGRPRTIDVTGLGGEKMGYSIGAGGAGFPTDSTGTAREWIGPKPTGGIATAKTPKTLSVTEFVARAKSLTGGFESGYEYGVDPTTGLSPAAALLAAIRGSELKAVKKSIPNPLYGANAKPPASGSKTSQLEQSMVNAANAIIGRPYGAAGGAAYGRPPNLSAGHYDCSSAVSTIIDVGGKGILPPVSSPWTTDSLKTWGSAGDGRHITVGVRGTSGQNAHTMMNFFGHWLESGGGGPQGRGSVHWDQGWDGAFPIHRHPPGYRAGGPVRFDRNEADWMRAHNLGTFRRGGPLSRPLRFQSGGHVHRSTPTRSDVPGRRTLHAPPVRLLSHTAATPAPRAPDWATNPTLPYQVIQSTAQIISEIPTTAINIGVKTTQAQLHKLQNALVRIAAGGDNAKVDKAFRALSGAIGNVGTMSYKSLQSWSTEIEKQLKAVQKKPQTTATKRAETRLQNALQVVDNEMGRRVGALVQAAENESAALDAANTRLQRLMARQGIDQSSAQGTAMIAQYQDQAVKVLQSTVAQLQKAYKLAQKSGDKKAVSDIASKLASAMDALDQGLTDQITDHAAAVQAAAQKVIDDATTGEQNLQTLQQIFGTTGTQGGENQLASYIQTSVLAPLKKSLSSLEQQLQAALKAGNGALVTALTASITSTTQAIGQATSDATSALEAAAQVPVDTATHGVNMATAGEQGLETQQDIAGTARTPAGAQQIAAYINSQIVPALQKELDALNDQLATAKSVGDTALANQIAESIAGVQNDILQESADALDGIKTATEQTAQNTEPSLQGQIGVGYQSETFPDFAGAMNGA